MSDNSQGTKEQSTPAVMAWVFAFLWPAGIGYAQELDFYTDVFPALESNCVSCHNKTSSESGLNLGTPDTIRKGGDSGPALVPSSGDESISERVSAVRFSPDGKMLATGSGEFSLSGDVHLWEVGSGKLSAVWRDKHRDSVLALDFSSNGKWIGSGSADRLAKVTEIATGRHVYALEAHTHHVLSVSFRADDKALATSGGDGVVNVWDMESGERKKKIVGWSKEVTALQYMGATSQIVASSGDNQVRIVSDDGTEVRAMTKLPDFMQSAASAHTANVIVAGGEDSALRVWDSATGKELATFSNR